LVKTINPFVCPDPPHSRILGYDATRESRSYASLFQICGQNYETIFVRRHLGDDHNALPSLLVFPLTMQLASLY